jgi:hypothetical protein
MTPLHKYALILLAVLALAGAGLSLILWSRLEVKDEIIDRQAKKLEAYTAQDAATNAADDAETQARNAAKIKEQNRANALEDLRKNADGMSDADYFGQLDGLLESAGNGDVSPAAKPAAGLPAPAGR